MSVIKDEAEYFVDLRIVGDNDQPSRKGQRLTLNRWKNLLTNIEDIQKEIDGITNEDDVDYRLHLGGNIFVTIKTPYRCVNLPKFRDGTIPTQEGISLKFGQWQHMIGRLNEIQIDIDSVIPCPLSEDH